MSASVKGLQNHQPVIDVLWSKWTMCNPKRAFDHLLRTSAAGASGRGSNCAASLEVTHDLRRLVPQVRLAEFGAFRLFQAGSCAESTASLLHKFVRQHSGHEGSYGPKDGRCGSVKVRPIRPGPEHRQVRAQRHR
jgi:hypothetical protein